MRPRPESPSIISSAWLAAHSSMESTPHARAAGIAAIAINVTNLVFTVILAVDLTTKRQRPYILSLTGAATQAILLCALSHLLLRYCRRARKGQLGRRRGEIDRRTLSVVMLGIIPTIVAGSIVGAALVWSKTHVAEQPPKILGSRRTTFLTVGIVSWAVAVLTQAIFYLSLLWTGTTTEPTPRPDHGDETQICTPMTENNQSSGLTAPLNPTQALLVSTSSPPSRRSSDTAGSLRSSLSLIQRAADSKPRLLIRQHSFPRQSNRFLDHPAPERWSHSEGFDSWDTSEVAPHIRETILQSSPATRGKPLEPIPGSRSPSPAKALEGPFYPETELSSAPTSPLPQPTYSRTTSRPHLTGLEISSYRHGQSASAPTSPRSPPGFSRPSSRQRAESGEDHIHPLFRTSSRNPPPTPSSNTVLTAAPEAGQIIRCPVTPRTRSGSLPSSSSSSTTPTSLKRNDSFGSSGRFNVGLLLPEVKPLVISRPPTVSLD